MLSLILLLPISLEYLNRNKAFEKQRVLEVNWWDPDKSSRSYFPLPPKRKFLDITLRDSGKDNETKLNAAQLAIRNLVATGDTIGGVHFHFADDVKYEYFVRALNICHIEKAITFVPYQNDLWVFNLVWIPPDEVVWLCGTMWFTKPIIPEEDLIKQLGEMTKTYWPSVLLFLIMTGLSIRHLRKDYVSRSLARTNTVG